MRRTLLIIATAALAVGLLAPAAAADPGPTTTYEVTLTNLAGGQPLSPPVAVTHTKAADLFSKNTPASDAIEAIAEDGNQSVAVAALTGAPGVTDVVDVGVPLLPAGATVPGLADTVTFTITGEPGNRFSLASMLICTNDGFTGADAVKLPKHGTRTYRLGAYDAGTEHNTQASGDIVDPCSAIGPVALSGDPNGNENAAVDTDGKIRRHPGITDTGDLTPALHDWDRTIATLTITPVITYEVTFTNLAGGQPLSPPVAVTHTKAADLFSKNTPASDAIEAIAEDGNQSVAVAALTGAPGVTDVVDVGVPLLPAGATVPGLADTVTFTITGEPGNRFSLASMLICTNDGFTGADAVKLPKHGTRTYRLGAYDAGTEHNTQASGDIVDPCSAIGPVALSGDPNGNENAAVDTDGKIRRHPGITDTGDLTPALHDWDRTIATLTITRLDG